MVECESCKRLFVLGAGFSKSANMPLSTEPTDMLIDSASYGDDEEKNDWLSDLKTRLGWIRGDTSKAINVEELFHYAAFDVEQWKMRQQLCPVGRLFGPATPHSHAEMIQHALDSMTQCLVDVIWGEENEAISQLDLIRRFASQRDSVASAIPAVREALTGTKNGADLGVSVTTSKV